MEKYSEYKDSGVQWLGEMPSHWGIRRLKTAYELHGRIGWNGLRSDEFRENSYAYLVTGQDFKASEVIWKNCYQIDKPRYDEDPFIQLKDGDILVTKDGSIGKIAKVTNLDKPACLNSGIFVVREKKMIHIQGYLYWLLKSPLLIKFNTFANSGSTTISHLYQNVFERMHLLCPPIDEQKSIVSYLDDKCGKIDRLLENKAKELELLAEMKQRVIADAVTKGLNPDVTMKDSGIPWLPQIPEHWETRKMKYVFNERSEKNHPEEPMLSATQTEGVIWQSKYKGRVVVVNAGFENLKFVKVGDFVIHLRSFQGGIEYAYDQGIISSAYTILEPRYTGLSGYYKYLFKSRTFIDLLKTCVTGIREGQNINYFKLKQNEIPFPSETEAEAIVSHIEEKVSKIDALADKLQKEIESIKEYKQRLISDVVTGQIKVC